MECVEAPETGLTFSDVLKSVNLCRIREKPQRLEPCKPYGHQLTVGDTSSPRLAVLDRVGSQPLIGLRETGV